MSRELPARPNPDHLRKQAKARLHHLQRQRPDTTLAAAQRAIAREYGFANWSKLIAHIEALADPEHVETLPEPRAGGTHGHDSGGRPAAASAALEDQL